MNRERPRGLGPAGHAREHHRRSVGHGVEGTLRAPLAGTDASTDFRPCQEARSRKE